MTAPKSTASPKSPGSISMELKMITETSASVMTPSPRRWSTVTTIGCTIPPPAALIRTAPNQLRMGSDGPFARDGDPAARRRNYTDCSVACHPQGARLRSG